MGVFAAMAILAALLAQALAPALPGSATGIAGLINITSFLAACTSQLVAAGGIALCLRLLGALLPWPNLGVAFRIIIVPATLGVVALTVLSAARPIDPELGRIVAVAAIVAVLSAVPLLWSAVQMRWIASILLLSALGASSDFGAYEMARRVGFANASSDWLGGALAGAGLCLDAGASLLAFIWAAQNRRRVAIYLPIILLFITVPVVLGQSGTQHTASGVLVVLHRSLEALATRPLLAFPTSVSHVLSLSPLPFAAALLLLPGQRQELRAALALCLLGRTATGAPAAALLSVGAALLVVGKLVEGDVPHRAFAAAEAAIKSR